MLYRLSHDFVISPIHFYYLDLFQNKLEAAKILYEELVSNNIIPEFEFDVDLWNEIGAKHGAWMFFKDSMWDKCDAEEKELIQVLSRLYVRFMKYEE